MLDGIEIGDRYIDIDNCDEWIVATVKKVQLLAINSPIYVQLICTTRNVRNTHTNSYNLKDTKKWCKITSKEDFNNIEVCDGLRFLINGEEYKLEIHYRSRKLIDSLGRKIDMSFTDDNRIRRLIYTGFWKKI